MNYKSMNAMANSFSISKEVADSLSATTSLAGSFAVTKAIADSEEVGSIHIDELSNPFNRQ